MRYCFRGLEPEVLKALPGYYIGTRNALGVNCRLTFFYKTRKEAQRALATWSFEIREDIKVLICNKGKGCFSGIKAPTSDIPYNSRNT